MSRRAPVPALALTAALLALTGCVERKLVIRSDPPGAIVALEDEELPGRTPVEVPFEWDGVRRVTLRKEGHHVLDATADVEARWYDWFPLDVFAQFLWPGTIDDVRTFDYRLAPYTDWQALDAEQKRAQEADAKERLAALKERADSHRTGGSAGPGATAPTVPESRTRPDAQAQPARPRGERGPPPIVVTVPPPVPPGVELPPPVPPPPLYPPEEPK